MAYADYQFYKDAYFGNAVPETDFPRYAELASREIDGITNKRLRNWFPEDEDEQNDIKWAVCILADAIHLKDMLTCSGMEQVGVDKQSDGTIRGKVITSVTSGSESIGLSAGGVSSNSLEGAALEKAANIKEVLEYIKGMYLSGIKYKDKGYYILSRAYGAE